MLSERKRAAVCRNLQKTGPLTETGRARLRAAARKNKPWRHSTGPKTPAGKGKVRQNALKHGDYASPSRAIGMWLATVGWCLKALCRSAAPSDTEKRKSDRLDKAFADLFGHWLPAKLDRDTALPWIAEHQQRKTALRACIHDLMAADAAENESKPRG